MQIYGMKITDTWKLCNYALEIQIKAKFKWVLGAMMQIYISIPKWPRNIEQQCAN